MLDGSVFLRAAAQQNQNQQNFFSNIAQGVANYQRGVDRQAQREQIKARQDAEANDPKNLAQENILQQLQSQGLSRDEAATQLIYGVQKQAFDPYSGTITNQPSVLQQLGLGQPTNYQSHLVPQGGVPQRANTAQNVGSYGQGRNPAITQNYGDIKPRNLGQADIEALIDGAGGVVAGTPRLEGRPQYSGDTPGAKKSTTNAAIGVDAALDTEAGKLGLKREDELLRERDTEELNLKSFVQGTKDINETIKDLYDNAGVFTNGLLSQASSGIGGTPAHDFASNLKVLESDAGLSKLIEVKKQGGTFGALQEKELDLLISSRAALAQSQSPAQFRENLITYQERRNRAIPLLTDVFEKKFGSVPEGLTDGLDKNIIKRSYKEGQTVYNPKTGERRVLRGGKWESAQ